MTDNVYAPINKFGLINLMNAQMMNRLIGCEPELNFEREREIKLRYTAPLLKKRLRRQQSLQHAQVWKHSNVPGELHHSIGIFK
jgi:hypothetical protein